MRGRLIPPGLQENKLGDENSAEHPQADGNFPVFAGARLECHITDKTQGNAVGDRERHGHHDHAGGAAAVARSMPIDCILLPREEPSQDVAALLNFVKNKSQIKQLASGQQYNLGSCRIDIIEAEPASSLEEKHNENESSAIMKITDKGKSVVFTGDATEEEEIAAAAAYIKADVLKVSHHGSKTSSSYEFLQAVHPGVAVISVGADNKFGHPAPGTLEKLQAIGAKVLRTDQAGNIKVVFDGSNCTCYSYRYQKEFF